MPFSHRSHHQPTPGSKLHSPTRISYGESMNIGPRALYLPMPTGTWDSLAGFNAIVGIIPECANYMHFVCYCRYTIPQGGYANNYFCKWRVSPISSCHRTGFLLLEKDFHDSNPSSGTNCEVKDHIHFSYSENQNEYFCGGKSANNCPVDNCPQGFQDSSR